MFLHGNPKHWFFKLNRVEFHGKLKAAEEKSIKQILIFNEQNFKNVDYPDVKLMSPKQVIEYEVKYDPPAL